MYKKSPWLYPYFCSCLIALLTSLQLENTSVMDVNTDCKSLQFFIFMDLKMVQSSAEFMNTTFLVHSTYNFFLFLFSLLHRGDFWNIFVSNFFLQCCFMFSFFLYYVLIFQANNITKYWLFGSKYWLFGLFSTAALPLMIHFETS